MTRIAEAPEGLSFYVAATSSRLVGCGPGLLGRGAPVPAGLANRCLVDYDARARRSRPTRLALSRIALRDDHLTLGRTLTDDSGIPGSRPRPDLEKAPRTRRRRCGC